LLVSLHRAEQIPSAFASLSLTAFLDNLVQDNGKFVTMIVTNIPG